MYLWGANGQLIVILDVEVTVDLAPLKAKLNELLPHENISIRSSQKKIVLSGEVSTLANMQAAIDLASSFLGPSQVLGGGTSGGGGGQGNINVSTSSAQPKVDPSKGGPGSYKFDECRRCPAGYAGCKSSRD